MRPPGFEHVTSPFGYWNSQKKRKEKEARGIETRSAGIGRREQELKWEAWESNSRTPSRE